MAKELSVNGKKIRVQAADVACDMTIGGVQVTNLQDALDLLVADANGDEPPDPLYAEEVKTTIVNGSDIGLPLEDVVYNAVVVGITVNNAQQALTRLTTAERPEKRTIRVLSWNVGHFTMGNDYNPYASTGIADKFYDEFTEGETYRPNGNYDVQKQRWDNMLTEIDADILLASEYSDSWSKTPAVEAYADIFGSKFPFYVNGTNYGYSHNALYNRRFAFQYAWNGELKEELALTGAGGRYLLKSMAVIADKDVVVAVTHLTPGNDIATRAIQIHDVIEDLSEYDYVILGGDFNVRDEADEFAAFAQAGYTLANCGAFGMKYTWPTTGWQGSYDAAPGVPYAALDNIIVKGFTIDSVSIIDDSYLTDHCGVVSDLTII